VCVCVCVVGGGGGGGLLRRVALDRSHYHDAGGLRIVWPSISLTIMMLGG
jgi:hypothetical protein